MEIFFSTVLGIVIFIGVAMLVRTFFVGMASSKGIDLVYKYSIDNIVNKVKVSDDNYKLMTYDFDELYRKIFIWGKYGAIKPEYKDVLIPYDSIDEEYILRGFIEEGKSLSKRRVELDNISNMVDSFKLKGFTSIDELNKEHEIIMSMFDAYNSKWNKTEEGENNG